MPRRKVRYAHLPPIAYDAAEPHPFASSALAHPTSASCLHERCTLHTMTDKTGPVSIKLRAGYFARLIRRPIRALSRHRRHHPRLCDDVEGAAAHPSLEHP
jgi:hypothetical protein